MYITELMHYYWYIITSDINLVYEPHMALALVNMCKETRHFCLIHQYRPFDSSYQRCPYLSDRTHTLTPKIIIT